MGSGFLYGFEDGCPKNGDLLDFDKIYEPADEMCWEVLNFGLLPDDFLVKIPRLQLLVHALALVAALVAHATVKVFSRVRKTFIKEVTLLIPLLPLQLSLQPLQQTEETKKTNQRIVMERLKTNLKPKMNLKPKISLKSKTNLNPKTILRMKMSRKMTRNLRMKMKFPSL